MDAIEITASKWRISIDASLTVDSERDTLFTTLEKNMLLY